MADWHAALPSLGAGLVGSTKHIDARPYRSRVVLRARRQDGIAACLHQEDAKDAFGRSGTGYQTKEGDRMKKADQKKKKGRIGSSFDDFLKEDGSYEGVTARAIKRVLVRQ